jgi:hypothetical protein
LIKVEGDGYSGADGREEGVSASIIAGSDTPPVFELGEEIFDLVALTVERVVVVERRLSAFGRSASALRNYTKGYDD